MPRKSQTLSMKISVSPACTESVARSSCQRAPSQDTSLESSCWQRVAEPPHPKIQNQAHGPKLHEDRHPRIQLEVGQVAWMAFKYLYHLIAGAESYWYQRPDHSASCTSWLQPRPHHATGPAR